MLSALSVEHPSPGPAPPQRVSEPHPCTCFFILSIHLLATRSLQNHLP